MSDDIRSFQGVNPTAGNLGAKDSTGRSLARELNRASPQDRANKRSGTGAGLTSVAQMMNGFKQTPQIGKVALGPGRSIDFGAAVDAILNKELDYG